MRPLVTAHAGCEGTVPNTINSISRAFMCGADIAEADVRLTADKAAVLSHDDIFSGIEISKTFYKNIPGILLLTEALVFARDNSYFLNLDIKDYSSIDSVYSDIVKTGSMGNVILSGCTPGQVTDIRAEYPGLKTMVNISRNYIDDSLLEKYYSDRDLFINTVSDIYTSTRCMCLNISLELCGEGLIEKFRKSYVPVSVWTVDDPAAAAVLADRGVYSITTNAVKSTLNALNRGSLMS